MTFRTVRFESFIGPQRLFVEGARPEMETEKPAILFVGGAFDGSWIARQQVDSWAAHGYPSYALNLRGYYRSRWRDVADLTYTDYLNDILTVRESLGLGRIILAGYSLGGLLAQKFAEIFGAHALVLYDPDPPREVAKTAGIPPSSDRSIPPVMNFWPSREIVEEMLGRPAEPREYRRLLDLFKQSYLSGKAYRQLEVDRIPVRAHKIHCPVLIIGISPAAPVQVELARYLNASRYVFEGHSHGSILLSRFHKPITRRVLGWIENGRPRGETRVFPREETKAGGAPFTLLYFTSWKAPRVRLCNSRGEEIGSVEMKRWKRGRTEREGIFRAELPLDPGERFFLGEDGEEDRPFPKGHYEPAGRRAYLLDGEFFPHPPPFPREKPMYLTREIASGHLQHLFRLLIMLPRDYDPRRGPYPVACLNDGQNQWKNQGAYGGWHTDAAALSAARRGRARDVVLVAIVSHPERDWSYLPPPRGAADRYVDFLAGTVLPRLRTEFALSADPREIAFLGSSYGANCAIYAGFRRPEVFGLIGAFSFAFAQEDPVRPLMLSSRTLPFRKLYLDCGTRWAYDTPGRDDYTALTREMIRLAREKRMVPGKNLLGIVAEGHFHNELFWRQRVGRCLEFLFPPI